MQQQQQHSRDRQINSHDFAEAEAVAVVVHYIGYLIVIINYQKVNRQTQGSLNIAREVANKRARWVSQSFSCSVYSPFDWPVFEHLFTWTVSDKKYKGKIDLLSWEIAGSWKKTNAKSKVTIKFVISINLNTRA